MTNLKLDVESTDKRIQIPINITITSSIIDPNILFIIFTWRESWIPSRSNPSQMVLDLHRLTTVM